MIVQPNLLGHPKFIAFKRELGDPSALEYLIRLWGHCQGNKRGEEWGKVSPAYVEAICGWTGEPGKLYNALKLPYCDKPGWIRVIGRKNVVVVGWADMNKTLVTNWNRNPSGRPAKGAPHGEATGKPRLPHGQATGTPIGLDERGLEERESTDQRARSNSPPAGIPNVEEIVRAGAALGIPPDYARHYFTQKQIKKSWGLKNGGLVNWQLEMETWWAKDKATWTAPTASEKTAGEKNRAQLEAELDCATDPEKRREISNQLKTLEKNQ